jgi:hypothetical protein
MSDPGDGGEPPRRALLKALLAMAGVALLVGLVLAAAAMTVVQVTGLGNASGAAASRPSLYMPKYHPTKSAEDTTLPSLSPSPTEHKAPKPSAKPQVDKITLFAAPQKVAPGGRINLNGVYVDGEGVALQVQRKDPTGWTDFPVHATVRGGAFDTWISTTHTGVNTFRVYDVQANRASNTVDVTVH